MIVSSDFLYCMIPEDRSIYVTIPFTEVFIYKKLIKKTK